MALEQRSPPVQGLEPSQPTTTRPANRHPSAASSPDETSKRTLLDHIKRWAVLADTPWWSRGLSALLFAAPPFLWHFDKIPTAAFALPALTARLGAGLVASRWRGLPAAGWIALGYVVLVYLFYIAVAVQLSPALAWTTSYGMRALVATLLVASFLGTRLPGKIRVPLTVPLGIWIAACAWGGWYQAERYVDCDDYLRIRDPVDVVVPSRRDLAQCRPGEKLPLGRFPRFSWDYPDGAAYLFTSQAWRDWNGPPAEVDTITGLVCKTPSSGTVTPRCVGGWQGKSQRIQDAPPLNEVFVGTWLLPLARSADGNRMMVFSLNDSLDMIAYHDFPDDVQGVGGDFIYQPVSDSIWIFGDYIVNRRVRASDFAPLPDGPINVFLFSRDYDAGRDEGVLCGLIGIEGQGWTNLAAFHGSPPTGRRLITMKRAPLLVAGAATGCALDAVGRKAYVIMMNLGLLAQFDYDSGRLEKTSFVGIGFRTMTYDGQRRRLYLADYLRRDIVAFDAESLSEVRRWPVGRFTRDVRLTHDRTALLVGSTVGLVRIRLND